MFFLYSMQRQWEEPKWQWGAEGVASGRNAVGWEEDDGMQFVSQGVGVRKMGSCCLGNEAFINCHAFLIHTN